MRGSIHMSFQSGTLGFLTSRDEVIMALLWLYCLRSWVGCFLLSFGGSARMKLEPWHHLKTDPSLTQLKFRLYADEFFWGRLWKIKSWIHFGLLGLLFHCKRDIMFKTKKMACGLGGLQCSLLYFWEMKQCTLCLDL